MEDEWNCFCLTASKCVAVYHVKPLTPRIKTHAPTLTKREVNFCWNFCLFQKKEKSLRNMLHISLSRKKDNADYKSYSIKITASSREVCINKTYLFTQLFNRSVDRERCSFLWKLVTKRDPEICMIKCHWSYTYYRELHTIYNGNNRCLNIAAQLSEAWGFLNY